MYNCDFCGHTTPPKQRKLTITVTEAVTYPARKGVNPLRINGRRVKPHNDPGGEGRQIVYELAACKVCYGKERHEN